MNFFHHLVHYFPTFFHGGTPKIVFQITRTSNSETSTKQTSCWQHTENNAALPIAGQKFPWCSRDIWNFSRYVKFIPRLLAEPLMVLCGTLLGTNWSNILKYNKLHFGNRIGPCLQACFLYSKMLLQNN